MLINPSALERDTLPLNKFTLGRLPNVQQAIWIL